jgi:Protein of unknown function VcgC/VcgE (DUF2780)
MKHKLISCLVLVGLLLLPSVGHSQAPQIPGLNADFMSSMSKALGGADPTKTAGAAGSIFGLAKSRLSAGDFDKVAKAVPGMDGLLKAAPAVTGTVPKTGLDSLTSSFSKLGLSADMVNKAIPVVTQFVTKSGGADVGKLLSGVLK